MSALLWLVVGWLGVNALIVFVLWLCRDEDGERLDVHEMLERYR